MLARPHGAAELRISHRHIERRVEIAKRHPLDEIAEASLFRRPVEAPVTVPLVDDIVVFGVQPAGELRMSPECVHRPVIIPTPIDVAGAPFISPNVAELRVEHWLMILSPTLFEVPG